MDSPQPIKLEYANVIRDTRPVSAFAVMTLVCAWVLSPFVGGLFAVSLIKELSVEGVTPRAAVLSLTGLALASNAAALCWTCLLRREVRGANHAGTGLIISVAWLFLVL